MARAAAVRIDLGDLCAGVEDECFDARVDQVALVEDPLGRVDACLDEGTCLEPRDGRSSLVLAEILAADDVALRARTHATPLSRPGPDGLRRNARAITRAI